MKDSLARYQSPEPMDETEMRAFAKSVWRDRGIPVFLDLAEIPNNDAAAIRRAAERLYGPSLA